MTQDPYAGMTPWDAARARAYVGNQARIASRRRAAARLLLAPPGPAIAVRRGWAAVVPQPNLTPDVGTPLPTGTLLGPASPEVSVPIPSAGMLYYDQTLGILYQYQGDE